MKSGCCVGLIGTLLLIQLQLHRSAGLTTRKVQVHRSQRQRFQSTVDSDNYIMRSIVPSNHALLSFSDDPRISEQRRKAFEKLQSIVMSLAEYEGTDAIQIVADGEETTTDTPTAIIINSLVFQLDKGNDTVVVILNSNNVVDTEKLKEVLGVSSCALAMNVEQVCGFPPGSVPPIGHSPNTLRTILDADLIQEGAFLLGGGGHPHLGCRIRVDMLLMLEGVEVADISLDIAPSKRLKTTSQDNVLKPFFPYPPPPTILAQEYYSQEYPSPLQPISVLILGRLSGVRCMAKKLCFLDLAPPNYICSGNSMQDQYDLPWKSGTDGKDMAVQLIAGKTFYELLGDGEEPETMKKFKPNQLVLIEGKTNVGNRVSLGNWIRKRSFDIVVFKCTLVEEGFSLRQEKSQSVPTIKVERHKQVLSCAELRRLQLSANLSTTTLPPGVDQNCLTLADIFRSEKAIVMVDDTDSVNEFASCLEHMLASLPSQPFDDEDDSSAPGLKNIGMIGIDCEWKPSFLMATPWEPQPVLLLQISVQPLQKVFLLDLQRLLRPLLAPSEAMNPLETEVCDVLTKVFLSHRLLKVGFQLKADFRLLAGSYPHITAFRVVHTVVEVSGIARKAMQLAKIRNSRQLVSSLARLTEYLTKKPLSKEQQVSDWSNRPLTPEQIEYSSLDAAILPFLFEKVLKLANATWFSTELQIGRWTDDSAFHKSIISLRFMFLDTDNAMVIRKLKAKRVVGDPYIVTQSWMTGTTEPELPSVPSYEGYGPYRDIQGILRMPAGMVSIGKNQDLLDSIVGQRVGKSKDKCLEALIVGNHDVPEGAMLEFQQRAGYVEFRDGVAMFVNMPNNAGQGRHGAYPNEWVNNGKSITWFMRDHEWNGGTSELAKKLLGNGTNGDRIDPLAMLFVRMGKGEFLSCGRCIVSPVSSTDMNGDQLGGSKDWGQVQLNLELLAFKKLEDLEDFSSMIHAQNVDSNAERGDSPDTGGVHEIVIAATNMEFEQTLLRLVEDGDLISAIYLATKHCREKSRSLGFGLDTLRQSLMKSNLDIGEALQIIEEAISYTNTD